MITIPSFWKLVAIAKSSPNSLQAQLRTSDAEKDSNLYQDYGVCCRPVKWPQRPPIRRWGQTCPLGVSAPRE